MDTFAAFARGRENRGKEEMVFDWDKAAELIAEHKPEVASAGLEGDWDWTGGTIWEEGKPVTDSYTFLSSTWATPQLEMDGRTYDCFVMKGNTTWGSDTKWPQSALDKLPPTPKIAPSTKIETPDIELEPN